MTEPAVLIGGPVLMLLIFGFFEWRARRDGTRAQCRLHARPVGASLTRLTDLLWTPANKRGRRLRAQRGVRMPRTGKNLYSKKA